MARFSRLLRKIKLEKLRHPAKFFSGFLNYTFTTELLLLAVMILTISVNVLDRTNSKKTIVYNRSLFFSFLKAHASFNPKLVDAYENVTHKLGGAPTFTKQILAASKKGETENLAPLPTLSGSALLKPNPAGSGGSASVKRDIEVYEVKNGDTVSRIATIYGISVDTILWENNLSSAGMIRPGQELKILPTTGIKHTVKDGETISGIAKKYGTDMEDILEYNEIEIEEHIFSGEEIIIPNATRKAPATPQRQQYLAELQKEDYHQIDVRDFKGGSGSLIWPLPATRRVSQYFWSRHRALDIPCRDCSIVASGSGIVELAGWQKGYGNTIVINHGDGLKTRYAHGKQNLVSAGDAVEQGQEIMISGSTGRSTGPHLHFEVKVGGNLVDPMKYVAR